MNSRNLALGTDRDTSPELPEVTLCRSACIAKTSEDILRNKSSTYMQFPDDGVFSAGFSSPYDTSAHVHGDTNKSLRYTHLKDMSILLSMTKNGSISAMKTILYPTGTLSHGLMHRNGNPPMRMR